MGYPSPIGGVSRKLSNNVFIHSAHFQRFGFLNFGSRMSVVKLSPENYIIFSAIPYEESFINSLTTTIEDPNWLSKVSHVIIPDKEHTMGILSFQGKLQPDVKYIGMETANEQVNKLINVKIDDSLAYKVLDDKDLSSVGITDPLFLNKIRMFFMPSHVNKELLMFDTDSSTLFTGDLFFNIQRQNTLNYKHCNEQFNGANALTGWSFFTRYLRPNSAVGQYLFKKFIGGVTEQNKILIQLLYNLKFDKLVMCHGDVIESDAYKVFKIGFKGFF